jgi:2-methylcitrate dehydratase PrpD
VTISQRLATFASSAVVPDEVRASVRARILDTVGVALGALPLDTSGSVAAHALDLGGASQASIIGSPVRVPAPSAAFVNGVLAHSLDYDDTHLPSILHPSATIVPAVLAAGQLVGATGAQVVDAAAIGIELCARLGLAGYDRETRTSRYFEKGQHATSICGAVAGAAAAARLLGLDETGIADAMGIAISMGSGVIEANRSGGTIKRLHCGIAAQSAVTAAMLAERGITGPLTAFEGRFGFFQAWIDGRYDAAPLTYGLGDRWETTGVFFKPYPCNHFTHAGIDAALAVRAHGIRVADISAIELGVATQTVRTIGEPVERKRAPETGYLAKFSGPYTIAAALLGGSGLGLGLDDFTDALATDPVRSELMARITVKPSAECDAIYPDQFPAILRVLRTDGTEHVEAVLTNRGGPQHPLSSDELSIKFRDCASRVLTDADASAIEEACANLSDAPSVDGVLTPTANAKEA